RPAHARRRLSRPTTDDRRPTTDDPQLPLLAPTDRRAGPAHGPTLLAARFQEAAGAHGCAPHATPARRVAWPGRADRRRPCAALARRGQGAGPALRVLPDSRVYAHRLQLRRDRALRRARLPAPQTHRRPAARHPGLLRGGRRRWAGSRLPGRAPARPLLHRRCLYSALHATQPSVSVLIP